MNQQLFEQAKASYQQGDWGRAASMLMSAKDPGELCGAVDHLRGNALMKLGLYSDAAEAYGDALADARYGKSGALACNRGRALLAAGRVEEAVASLQQSLQDTTYATPYKANMALGSAYERMGNVREAGVAYRNAAIDENNPDPSAALAKLGESFLGMGRPVDAVEALRTALDFSAPLASQNAVYAQLGSAYVAANRMPEAVEAFGNATKDGTYQLSPEQQASYDAARKATAAISGRTPSETDAFLAAAGYGSGIDPLDPLGRSGEMMPSPEDTGFFSVTEQDLMRQNAPEHRPNRQVKRRNGGGGGGKAVVIILLILLLVGGGAGFAFYSGFGWPTQEAQVQGMFNANASNSSIKGYLASSLSSESVAHIEAVLPKSSQVTIDGMDRSMSSTTMRATAQLPSGGSQIYEIQLVRDGIGWKVSAVNAVYASQSDGAPTLSNSTQTTTGTVSTDAATTGAATTGAATTAAATTAAATTAASA